MLAASGRELAIRNESVVAAAAAAVAAADWPIQSHPEDEEGTGADCQLTASTGQRNAKQMFMFVCVCVCACVANIDIAESTWLPMQTFLSAAAASSISGSSDLPNAARVYLIN